MLLHQPSFGRKEPPVLFQLIVRPVTFHLGLLCLPMGDKKKMLLVMTHSIAEEYTSQSGQQWHLYKRGEIRLTPCGPW